MGERTLATLVLAVSGALALYWVLDPARSMAEVWVNRAAAIVAVGGVAAGAYVLGVTRG